MPTTARAVNATWARTLVDALVRAGARRLMMSPGLRSVPLVHAARETDGLVVDVFVDERCAAFAAAGYAKVTGEPTLLLSTSGSAGAHWLPAFIEARHAGLPLIGLTADRPARLRDCGAPQTIDQRRLFGDTVLDAVELPAASLDDAALRAVRGVAARAVQRALGPPAGPVHLDVPLDVPLEPAASVPDAGPRLTIRRGRRVPDPATVGELAELVRAAPRGLVVAGPEAGEAGATLARASGYPLLADPLSGLRFAEVPDVAVIARYDAALTALVDAGDPPGIDLVLRVGGTPTSKGWARLLEARPARHVLIDPTEYREPSRGPATLIAADPGELAAALTAELTEAPADAAWRDAWRELDRRADVDLPGWFEGAVARQVLAALPDGATLWAASSKPVRELDWFGAAGGDLAVYAARGANGIDGTVSQALGAARGRPGHPAALLIGDLGLLHDLGGLWAVGRDTADLTIVVVNDGGGGIFELLPVAGQREGFEEHVAVAHEMNFANAAAQFGVAYACATDAASLDTALAAAIGTAGPTLIEVPLDRADNTAAHEAWRTRVAEAVEGWRP